VNVRVAPVAPQLAHVRAEGGRWNVSLRGRLARLWRELAQKQKARRGGARRADGGRT